MRFKITKKYKIILISTLIGFIAFPTISLGGTFIASLIQGKTVEEAVNILAEQMDALIGRVDKLEDRQKELEEQQEQLEQLRACTRWTDYVQAKEDIEYYQTNDLIDADLNVIDPKPNGSPNTLDREKFKETKERYEKYQELKTICGTEEVGTYIPENNSRDEEIAQPNEQVEQKKATGIIKIYYEREGAEFKEISKDHNLEGQTLIESTRFLDSKTGYLYRLTESIIVPSGYIVYASIQADAYGEDHAISCSESNPCIFNVPGFKGSAKYDQIYGKAFSDFNY